MTTIEKIETTLLKLKLSWIRQEFESLCHEATQKQISYPDFLLTLLEGEKDNREENTTQRRMKQARFPTIKTLDGFDWKWPKKINVTQVKQLFDLHFLQKKQNAVFIGGIGTGKTHLATALGVAACKQGKRVLYASTIDAINNLLAAQKRNRLKEELKKYQSPDLLILDELGYLPIDRNGSNLLFQIISERYEKKSTIITTNKAYTDWLPIFHNDSTVTSAILDRILHHCETILIEGDSYRMRKKTDS